MTDLSHSTIERITFAQIRDITLARSAQGGATSGGERLGFPPSSSQLFRELGIDEVRG